MKIFAGTLLIAAVAMPTGAPEVSTSSPGRYQLVPAEVSITDGHDTCVKAVFRINTITGQAWIYRSVSLPASEQFKQMTGDTNAMLSVSGWEPIADDFTREYTNMAPMLRPPMLSPKQQ